MVAVLRARYARAVPPSEASAPCRVGVETMIPLPAGAQRGDRRDPDGNAQYSDVLQAAARSAVAIPDGPWARTIGGRSRRAGCRTAGDLDPSMSVSATSSCWCLGMEQPGRPAPHIFLADLFASGDEEAERSRPPRHGSVMQECMPAAANASSCCPTTSPFSAASSITRSAGIPRSPSPQSACMAADHSHASTPVNQCPRSPARLFSEAANP